MFGLVSKFVDIISNIAENAWISIPYNGKFPNVAVTPNNPKKAGNNPAKQPGHAPPISPKNAPTPVIPECLFTSLYSLNFIIIKFIFKATKKPTNKVNKIIGNIIYKL